MAIQSKNPATGEVLKSFEELSDSELASKLELAFSAFQSWKKTTFAERAKLLLKLSAYLVEHKTELGKLSTLEMGKAAFYAEGEIEKSALNCEYYAENAEKFLANEYIEAAKAKDSYVRFDPLGVVLAVMPWNFPYWQVFRGAAPILMAGNTMVLKHASNVPQCAEAIETAFTECGFPKGVFVNLRIGAGRVEQVIRDHRIAAVTLTGSEKAGSEVAKVAGSEIKKCVLELGGNDPFIVMADADLNLATEIGVASRISNNAGQACNAAKRFIVHRSVAEKFTAMVVESFKNLKIGDPFDISVRVGPLASEQVLLDTEKQIADSISRGAKLALGGQRWGKLGFYCEPTVLTHVKKGMPAFDEEIFGPVIAIMEFETVAEAIALANDSQYGLGATIISADIDKAKSLASQIESGNVFINAMVRSDPRLPFGGIKKSGYGRELGSYGIKEFTNIKTVLIK